MDLQPPILSLPPLRDITAHSLTVVTTALINLRALYWPASTSQVALHWSKSHVDENGPDSGYASAEEDEDEETAEERLSLLRADALERAFAVRWLTGFIARSEEWVTAASSSPLFVNSGDNPETDEELENRARVVDEAAMLLALSADTQADGALTRRFSFAVGGGGEEITVELKDEPYDQDHESVGLQTWGSACVLAGRICADPGKYFGSEDRVGGGETVRRIKVLELGAGTGLLSMTVAKLQTRWARDNHVQFNVVATDFHPAVLENLRRNVTCNFSPCADAVQVDELDWADPPLLQEGEKFDVILAADVIYDKRHGGWIKSCAERMLRHGKRAVMYLIIPRRPTRTGEIEGVDDVFQINEGHVGLRIASIEDIARCSSVGRADEVGYKLFTIRWVG